MSSPTYAIKNETKNLHGDRVILYYYYRECNTAGEKDAVTYSIGIDMYTQVCGERTLKEEKVIDSVFTAREQAQKFIEILCGGCVTPVSLCDVIYDYLSGEAI